MNFSINVSFRHTGDADRLRQKKLAGDSHGRGLRCEHQAELAHCGLQHESVPVQVECDHICISFIINCEKRC